MRNTYRNLSQKQGRVAPATADQCYACNKFFIQRKSLERHLNSCGHMPGLAYKFENQSIQTFFDNVKFMGDSPFILVLKPQMAKNIQF